MAFFDSPKNRALWERKLSVLREEKARRKENGYSPVDREGKAGDRQDNPSRKRINLKELEARIEREQARRRERPERRMGQVRRTMEAADQAGRDFREAGGQAGRDFREAEGQPGHDSREAGTAKRQPVKDTGGRQL